MTIHEARKSGRHCFSANKRPCNNYQKAKKLKTTYQCSCNKKCRCRVLFEIFCTQDLQVLPMYVVRSRKLWFVHIQSKLKTEKRILWGKFAFKISSEVDEYFNDIDIKSVQDTWVTRVSEGNAKSMKSNQNLYMRNWNW